MSVVKVSVVDSRTLLKGINEIVRNFLYLSSDFGNIGVGHVLRYLRSDSKCQERCTLRAVELHAGA